MTYEWDLRACECTGSLEEPNGENSEAAVTCDDTPTLNDRKDGQSARGTHGARQDAMAQLGRIDGS
jgi:hypothetical protein